MTRIEDEERHTCQLPPLIKGPANRSQRLWECPTCGNQWICVRGGPDVYEWVLLRTRTDLSRRIARNAWYGAFEPADHSPDGAA